MWRYKLILFFIFIPLVVYTLWQSIHAFELRYFLQRLGLYFGVAIKPNGIWIHAASVGEVNAVIPLIIKIQKNNPNISITLTSNTLTSAAVVKKQLPDIHHYYFPLDYRWAIKRIINKIKPKNIFIVETEFWPNFYTQAHKQNIPLVIINGRISEKTLHAKNWLKNIYAKILPLVTRVYARSDTDQTRFIKLGSPLAKIEVLGNIKYSMPVDEKIEAIELHRKYVLAASTREDEESIIVKSWLASKRKDHLLVIVPRHPKRLMDVISQLKPFNINIAVRSKNDPVSKTTDIYIADTIGELKQFIAGSEFVLMGGSFVPKGGHNILEVAQLGKAVIFGPDMRNFKDEAQLFLYNKIGLQCESHELPKLFNRLLIKIEFRRNLEKTTTLFVKENSNIINAYYKKLYFYM